MKALPDFFMLIGRCDVPECNDFHVMAKIDNGITFPMVDSRDVALPQFVEIAAVMQLNIADVHVVRYQLVEEYPIPSGAVQ